MPTYIITIEYKLEADDAVAAHATGQHHAGPHGNVVGVKADKPEKPTLSDPMGAYIRTEIDYNDDDLHGDSTTLAYVSDSLQQQPDDIIAEEAHAPKRGLRKKLQNELADLIKHYGPDYPAGWLLD